MVNGIFEEKSSENESLYSTMDRDGTDLGVAKRATSGVPLNLTEVL